MSYLTKLYNPIQPKQISFKLKKLSLEESKAQGGAKEDSDVDRKMIEEASLKNVVDISQIPRSTRTNSSHPLNQIVEDISQ